MVFGHRVISCDFRYAVKPSPAVRSCIAAYRMLAQHVLQVCLSRLGGLESVCGVMKDLSMTKSLFGQYPCSGGTALPKYLSLPFSHFLS